MRHLTSLFDLSPVEVREILDLAKQLKAETKAGQRQPLLSGKVLTQIFEKPSLRTRLSFEAGFSQLGGSAMFLSGKDAGLNGREPLQDVARIVGGYSDIVVLRTFSQELIETFAKHANCPIINGLSDDYHPCQALTDIFTIEEAQPSETVQGKCIVYVGDGNNVAKSLAIICGQLGAEFRIAAPADYQLDAEFLNTLSNRYPQGKVTQFTDALEAVAGADVIYTDVWASMGQEDEKEQRAQIFADYSVTTELLDAASNDVRFMHCLPARRGLEVTAEVMDDPRSIVFPQAENRMHLAKGLMVWLIQQA